MGIDMAGLRERAWTLDAFVDQVNELLPEVLPKDVTGRAAEPVNQRLIRHYATQALVDEPLKEGRESRYLFRHLLQTLLVRRLLAEGYTAAVVIRVLEGRSDPDLERLLAGDLKIDLVPAHEGSGERADFLKQVRERAGLDAPPPGRAEPAARTAEPAEPLADLTLSKSPFRDSSWNRVEILDGLELMVRSDFRLPTTKAGDSELFQLLKVTLLYLEQRQKGKS